jgi:hypothetical protein|tara:strand:+ start:1616 stop:1825 length:210 start_codon:yes stop_codon:yes gene_type:complete
LLGNDNSPAIFETDIAGFFMEIIMFKKLLQTFLPFWFGTKTPSLIETVTFPAKYDAPKKRGRPKKAANG